MEQMKLIFKNEQFKKGDKVKIINKSIGWPLPNWGFKKGDIVYIKSIQMWDNKLSYFLQCDLPIHPYHCKGRFLHCDLIGVN